MEHPTDVFALDDGKALEDPYSWEALEVPEDDYDWETQYWKLQVNNKYSNLPNLKITNM